MGRGREHRQPHGEPRGEHNTIRVGKATYEALTERYIFEPLGEKDAKGIGRLPAWRPVGRQTGIRPAAGQPDEQPVDIG